MSVSGMPGSIGRDSSIWSVGAIAYLSRRASSGRKESSGNSSVNRSGFAFRRSRTSASIHP